MGAETETTALTDVIDEIIARRAVAGVDADVLAAGGTPDQAEAVRAALRHYLLGDEASARMELAKVYKNGMVDRLIEQFTQGAAAAMAARSTAPARAA